MRPRTLLVPSLFSLLTLAACGGAPPPEAPPAPTAAPAAPTAAPTAAPKADTAKADGCIAKANASRAKASTEPPKIGVKHILVKHKDAKNPVAGVTRTRAEACLRAQEALDKLKGGDDFDAVVKAFSDEPGAATRAGSLGTIERKDVVTSFANAAFELRINDVSDVVESPSGFHIIFRNQ